MSSTEPPLGVTKPISEETVTDADDAADEEPDENEILALWDAVREGDKAVIDEMLVGDEEHPPITGASIDMVDESGMTILHWLTVEGHASVRAQPAPPLPCAATRPAVLTAAVAAPLAQVAQWLIDEVKADVDARDPRLQTPLHHAGLKGHVSRRRRASDPADGAREATHGRLLCCSAD